MEIRIMPINYSLLFGDAASQTFAATAAGTYTLSTSLAAGLYEITTDTSQSSFTLGFADANGIKYTGTIRGGKGYISVGSAVTKIVIPAGMTYPLNINIRLGNYTQTAAPTSASFNWVANTGANVIFTFTPPAGATDIVVYWRDGTSTSLSSTSSPSSSIVIPGSYTTGNSGYAVLVAKDANGVTGLGVSLTTTSTYVNPPIMGGTPTTYTFTGSGTLTVNTTSNIDYFVVAGGGPGGNDNGGGGGGGGSTSGTRSSVSAGTYAVTVGAGGVGTTNRDVYGSDGGTSSIAFPSAVSVAGGGAGGNYAGVNNNQTQGKTGGCGGGGSMGYGASAPQMNGGTASAGFAGGNGQTFGYSNWNGAAGGGGGGGGAGGNATTGSSGDGGNGNGAGRPGAGGNGVANSLRTGSSVTYAGGGGGTSGNPTFGNGTAGTGGGTAGNRVGGSTAAAANTGGGSGGSNGTSGNGGSGIVVVRVAL
jgi:hypothetical protein